ncbi:MAG: hypothetical protein COA91_04390 [Robiginitomaculum sp.]|nr:MAG: hypothetical protein COA91_04390 [Robiginitomaculum sp.]
MIERNLKHKPIYLVPIEETNSGFDPHINTELLVQRINALLEYLSGVKGEVTAQNHARELSSHIKNIKDADAYNKIIAETNQLNNQDYSHAEKEVLAAELAELIFQNGGII